jgi:hypothetical protein
MNLLQEPTVQYGARLLDTRCRFWGPYEMDLSWESHFKVGDILRTTASYPFAFIALRVRDNGKKVLVDTYDNVVWGDWGWEG